ncbi:head morphogenesis protein [Mesorhizobium sp. UC22_110]|uniref:head morphogenesis protein n=1 Tax=unclassified Mesorhizobium TaxID=325217 RepID=UPI00366AFB1A
MLQRLSSRQRLEILVQQFEPVIRAAFMEAIDDIRSNIVLRRIAERLERADIAGAIKALNLDEAAFRPLEEALRQAFNGGGVAAVEQMPALRDPDGHQVVVRWDARNLAAEQWLREHSAMLVTNIVEDQKVAIRSALEQGLSRGDNPTKTALQVAGRVNRVTGKREGGIVGLTAQQSQHVASARLELALADPDGIRNYLQRGRRDKRFDRSVLKAFKDGKPIPAETVDRIVTRYADGLLKLRADTIALNETFEALAVAKEIAFRQQIDKGRVQAQAVTKTWRRSPSEHPRLQHTAMHGQAVQFDQPFIAPDGTPIPYPYAPGVPARHKLGCKCFAGYKIDFVAANA